MNKEFEFYKIENWNFSKLDKDYYCSGIYMLIFPNGMRYLGKSVHINERIRQHFKAFSFSSDWHSIARPSFTRIKLVKPEPELPDPTHKYNMPSLIRNYQNAHYPEWKRLSKKRREIIYEEYILPLYKEYLESVKTHDREEKKYWEDYYKMSCDFFNNVQLYVWKVPKEDITRAENSCLSQIAIEEKKFRYYNKVYPRNVKKENEKGKSSPCYLCEEECPYDQFESPKDCPRYIILKGSDD